MMFKNLISFQILFKISSFEEFFGYFPNKSLIGKHLNQIPLTGYLISDSAFTHFFGGAITISTTKSIELLIESCLFYNCSRHTNGGAIYFQSTEFGSIVLNKVCASHCFTNPSSEGQFIFIYQSSTQKATFQLTTITACSHDIQLTPYSSVFIQNCPIDIKNLNSSKNNCHFYSCFYFHTSRVISLNFSTFTYNNCIYYHLFFYSSGGVNSRTIIKCNIIGNEARTPGYGIIYSGHDRIIFQFCIFELNNDILFNGLITIQNSSIKHSSGLYIGSAVTFLYASNSIISTQTYVLDHFSTFACVPLYDNQEITACQTIPPQPTECQLNSNNQNNLRLISVLEFFSFSSLIMILY